MGDKGERSERISEKDSYLQGGLESHRREGLDDDIRGYITQRF